VSERSALEVVEGLTKGFETVDANRVREEAIAAAEKGLP
jgi:hypothetical protein